MIHIEELENKEEMENVFLRDNALIFKNSKRCGISKRALEELQKFARESEEEIGIFIVEVTERRDICDEITAKTGIVHQSPQIILLRKGNPIWHASHFEITRNTIEKAVSENKK